MSILDAQQDRRDPLCSKRSLWLSAPRNGRGAGFNSLNHRATSRFPSDLLPDFAVKCHQIWCPAPKPGTTGADRTDVLPSWGGPSAHAGLQGDSVLFIRKAQGLLPPWASP